MKNCRNQNSMFSVKMPSIITFINITILIDNFVSQPERTMDGGLRSGKRFKRTTVLDYFP